jgi:3-hydroxyisobutyrate dehydrogenase
MVAGDFEPPRSAVDIFVKDLGLVLEAAGDADLPLAAAARARFTQAHDAGMGRLDDSSLIRLAAPEPD